MKRNRMLAMLLATIMLAIFPAGPALAAQAKTDVPSHNLISGNTGTIDTFQNQQYVIEGRIFDVTGVRLNDVPLRMVNYDSFVGYNLTDASGATVGYIQLPATDRQTQLGFLSKYLLTLPAGEHKFEVEFGTTSCVQTFTIAKESDKTGWQKNIHGERQYFGGAGQMFKDAAFVIGDKTY